MVINLLLDNAIECFKKSVQRISNSTVSDNRLNNLIILGWKDVCLEKELFGMEQIFSPKKPFVTELLGQMVRQTKSIPKNFLGRNSCLLGRIFPT